MENVAISSSAPAEVRDVFDYVLTLSKLDENSKVKDIRSEVAHFLQERPAIIGSPECKQNLMQQVYHFSFYDLNNFAKETEKGEVLFKKMVILSRFKDELIKRLSDQKKNTIDFGKLERKVSPPLEAYTYTGNNKIDISPSNRSYGLLFE